MDGWNYGNDVYFVVGWIYDNVLLVRMVYMDEYSIWFEFGVWIGINWWWVKGINKENEIGIWDLEMRILEMKLGVDFIIWVLNFNLVFFFWVVGWWFWLCVCVIV